MAGARDAGLRSSVSQACGSRAADGHVQLDLSETLPSLRGALSGAHTRAICNSGKSFWLSLSVSRTCQSPPPGRGERRRVWTLALRASASLLPSEQCSCLLIPLVSFAIFHLPAHKVTFSQATKHLNEHDDPKTPETTSQASSFWLVFLWRHVLLVIVHSFTHWSFAPSAASPGHERMRLLPPANQRHSRAGTLQRLEVWRKGVH